MQKSVILGVLGFIIALTTGQIDWVVTVTSFVFGIFGRFIKAILFIAITFLCYEGVIMLQAHLFGDEDDKLETSHTVKVQSLVSNDSNEDGAVSVSDQLRLKYQVSIQLADSMAIFAEEVITNFISQWFTESVSPDMGFINEVRNVFTYLLGSFHERSTEFRTHTFLADEVFSRLRHHLRWFRDLSSIAIRKDKSLDLSDSNGLPPKSVPPSETFGFQRAVLHEYKSHGRLHPACLGCSSQDLKWNSEPMESEKTYLRLLATEIMQRTVPEEAIKCKATFFLLRELLTCSVFLPTLNLVCPENILNWLVMAFDPQLEEDMNKSRQNGYKQQKIQEALNELRRVAFEFPPITKKTPDEEVSEEENDKDTIEKEIFINLDGETTSEIKAPKTNQQPYKDQFEDSIKALFEAMSVSDKDAQTNSDSAEHKLDDIDLNLLNTSETPVDKDGSLKEDDEPELTKIDDCGLVASPDLSWRYFAGVLNPQLTETTLHGLSKGHFLIRQNPKAVDSFEISYVKKRGQFEGVHYMLKEEKVVSKGKEYDSVMDLVESLKNLLLIGLRFDRPNESGEPTTEYMRWYCPSDYEFSLDPNAVLNCLFDGDVLSSNPKDRENLELFVEQSVVAFIGTTTVDPDNIIKMKSENLGRFILAIEALLRHGVNGDISMGVPQREFLGSVWLRAPTVAQDIMQALPDQNPLDGVLGGLVWIRSALQSKQLHAALDSLLDEALLEEHYHDYALFRCKEFTDRIIPCLAHFGMMKFDLIEDMSESVTEDPEMFHGSLARYASRNHEKKHKRSKSSVVKSIKVKKRKKTPSMDMSRKSMRDVFEMNTDDNSDASDEDEDETLVKSIEVNNMDMSAFLKNGNRNNVGSIKHTNSEIEKVLDLDETDESPSWLESRSSSHIPAVENRRSSLFAERISSKDLWDDVNNNNNDDDDDEDEDEDEDDDSNTENEEKSTSKHNDEDFASDTDDLLDSETDSELEDSNGSQNVNHKNGNTNSNDEDSEIEDPLRIVKRQRAQTKLFAALGQDLPPVPAVVNFRDTSSDSPIIGKEGLNAGEGIEISARDNTAQLISDALSASVHVENDYFSSSNSNANTPQKPRRISSIAPVNLDRDLTEIDPEVMAALPLPPTRDDQSDNSSGFEVLNNGDVPKIVTVTRDQMGLSHHRQSQEQPKKRKGRLRRLFSRSNNNANTNHNKNNFPTPLQVSESVKVLTTPKTSRKMLPPPKTISLDSNICNPNKLKSINLPPQFSQNITSSTTNNNSSNSINLEKSITPRHFALPSNSMNDDTSTPRPRLPLITSSSSIYINPDSPDTTSQQRDHHENINEGVLKQKSFSESESDWSDSEQQVIQPRLLKLLHPSGSYGGSGIGNGNNGTIGPSEGDQSDPVKIVVGEGRSRHNVEGKKKFVVYQLFITQGHKRWEIWRRYSHFLLLHKTLKGNYRDLLARFPKRKFINNFTPRVINKRRQALQLYVTELLEFPKINNDIAFKRFILPSDDAERRAVVTIDDDVNTASNTNTNLNNLNSTNNQNPSNNSNSYNGGEGDVNSNNPEDFPISPRDTPNEDNLAGGTVRRAIHKDRSINHVEKQAMRLLSEIFELHAKGMMSHYWLMLINNVIRLSFTLKGSLSRWVKLKIAHYTAPDQLASFFHWIREAIFPSGRFMDLLPPIQPKQLDEARDKMRQQFHARLGIAPLGHILGASSSVIGFVKLYDFLQHPIALKSFMYHVFDALLLQVFPDIDFDALHHVAAKKNESNGK